MIEGQPFPYHVENFLLQPLRRPQIRRDFLIDRHVIISTDRAYRPIERAIASKLVGGRCPFCAGNEEQTPPAVLTVPNSTNGWLLRVVPNRFPALRPGAVPSAEDGYGWHELVIECSHHEANISRLSVEHIALVLAAYQSRVRAMQRDERIAYAQVFKNCGAPSGASLEHAHSQILAMPRVPTLVQAELDAAQKYYREFGKCPFANLIDTEIEGPRLVAQTPRFVALAPYASRFPFELLIVPRAAESHFERADLDGLADLLRWLLYTLDVGLNDPPYNVIIHTASFQQPDLPYYRWHVEILPRITGTAGFEWATDWAINPVPPEQAAEYLRAIGG